MTLLSSLLGSQVLKEEIPRIYAAASCMAPHYVPKLTFLIVQKRHPTRLFPVDVNNLQLASKKGNLKSGVVVDRVITDKFLYDFFLQSHNVINVFLPSSLLVCRVRVVVATTLSSTIVSRSMRMHSKKSPTSCATHSVDVTSPSVCLSFVLNDGTQACVLLLVMPIIWRSVIEIFLELLMVVAISMNVAL